MGTTRKTIDGRSIRWNETRAEQARAAGLWVPTTLGDALREAARETPDRVVLVDGDVRLTCADLYRRASALAVAMVGRMPTGSVVSFMLPNWSEAAVVYLGATLAGMVVNPILPSLRDHELRFILGDADTRMIFVPETFRGYDYAAMLTRVVDEIDTRHAGRTLREGLAMAIDAGSIRALPLDALAAQLSAVFDRAALAVAHGARVEDQRAVLRAIIEGLSKP